MPLELRVGNRKETLTNLPDDDNHFIGGLRPCLPLVIGSLCNPMS
jgi:hypothetical protein